MVSVQLLICSDFVSQYVYVTNKRIGVLTPMRNHHLHVSLVKEKTISHP